MSKKVILRKLTLKGRPFIESTNRSPLYLSNPNEHDKKKVNRTLEALVKEGLADILPHLRISAYAPSYYGGRRIGQVPPNEVDVRARGMSADAVTEGLNTFNPHLRMRVIVEIYTEEE